MKTNKLALIAAALFLVSCVVLGQQAAKSVVRVTPDQVKWIPEPDGLGFQQAIVEGDPKKAGVYIVWVKFPPGVMSRPHFHREDRYGTVIKGTWWTGEGDTFAPGKTVPLKPG